MLLAAYSYVSQALVWHFLPSSSTDWASWCTHRISHWMLIEYGTLISFWKWQSCSITMHVNPDYLVFVQSKVMHFLFPFLVLFFLYIHNVIHTCSGVQLRCKGNFPPPVRPLPASNCLLSLTTRLYHSSAAFFSRSFFLRSVEEEKKISPSKALDVIRQEKENSPKQNGQKIRAKSVEPAGTVCWIVTAGCGDSTVCICLFLAFLFVFYATIRKKSDTSLLTTTATSLTVHATKSTLATQHVLVGESWADQQMNCLLFTYAGNSRPSADIPVNVISIDIGFTRQYGATSVCFVFFLFLSLFLFYFSADRSTTRLRSKPLNVVWVTSRWCTTSGDNNIQGCSIL